VPYNVGNENAEVSIGELANILVRTCSDKRLRVVRQARPESGGYMDSAISRNAPARSKHANEASGSRLARSATA